MKVGDMIYTTTIRIFTGTEDVFYWIRVPCEPEKMTKKMAAQVGADFVNTPADKRHGPFKSEAECNENQRLVLFGPDCVIRDGVAGNDTIN